MKQLLPLLQKLEKINTLYIATFLFFLTFFVYGNTLGNELFYDDEQFIYKNIFVQSFDIVSFFTRNVDAGAGVVSNYYRPLLLLSFGIEHLLVGNTPFLYHLTNLLFQAGSGIFLYILLIKLFQNKLIALCTSILFIIHPLQTEAIAYVSGRGDPMGMFFMLLSVYLSFKTTLRGKLAAGFFFICALLSKELTIITPLIIFLCHMAVRKDITNKHIKEALKTSLPFIGINVIYIILRLTVLNFANTLNFYNGHNIYSDSIVVRLITFLSLLPQYLNLVLYPRILFIDRNATIVMSPNAIILATFILICLLGGCAFYWRKKSVIPLFAFLFFFIAFIPTSGLIPINGIFFEHFFYYPSVGFFLFLSYLLYLLFTHIEKHLQGVLLSIIVVCLGLLSIRSISRNAQWHDPITFYTQTLTHTQSARIYNNLAMSYADSGEQKKAIDMYKSSIKLADFYPQSHYNLGNSYADLGDLSSAESEYKKSLQMNPYFYQSYLKLFALYKYENKTNKQK
jgi:hypothetical protein